MIVLRAGKGVMDSAWWYAEPIDGVVRAGFEDEGDCRGFLGGAAPKRWLRSRANGRRYIYKAEDQLGRPCAFRAQADRTAALVAGLLLEPGEYIPVGLYYLDYGKGPVLGSVQPFIEEAQPEDFRWPGPCTEELPPYLAAPVDRARVQREQVVDWLIANHDTHGNQWVRVNGVLLGIDKTQACKHLGEDRLDPDYHPNGVYGEDYPVYHYLFHAAREGCCPVDPAVLAGLLARAGGLADDDFLAAFAGYLEAAGPRGETFPALLRERKHNLAHDFGEYYTRMLGRAVAF
jgi:hypothetical protein